MSGTEETGGAEDELGVLYVHFGSRTEEEHAALLALLAGFTPAVQALPPDAAYADVRGALRYFGCGAEELARLVRCRVLAHRGTDCTVGVAANRQLARMAAQAGPPGGVRAVRPEDTAAFLARRPAAALDGVGQATARTLCAYGLDTVGRIAETPPGTLQRILGVRAGRRMYERARGVDPVPVTPSAPARSASAEYRFGHDELDRERRRRALLTLADELGYGMREDGTVARAVTLTVRYAGRDRDDSTTRTRTLPEPTSHTPDLAAAAYALHEALGLQRARVRSVALRAEQLGPAEHAVRQLSFDPRAEKSRRAEEAADRARRRFGASAVGPAGLLDAA
ncbi:hypothetical protein [Streptomyces sp. ODS28]|uniref:DNA polymerase Y family protein n=1 Tax=Streptomyces sp. ODS28 TaxID=3136688 RepID=UPI0031E83423